MERGFFMGRIAYVNGRYLPLAQAGISVLDRGFVFADGVYEVSAVLDGGLVDNGGHLDRLARSLAEIRLDWPVARPVLEQIQRRLIARNAVREGLVYMQITRGAAPRDFKFPKQAAPSLVMFCQHKRLSENPLAQSGVAVISIPEIRWKRRDIKSVALLAQVLGKQQAAEAGAFEAWMVDESGLVTEGTSSNAHIVDQDGCLWTHPVGPGILNGITRKAVLRLAEEAGLVVVEKAFSLQQAHQAREAMMTSATGFVLPIVRLDGQPIANGIPGPLVSRLRDHYIRYARETLA
jgi:D-alanine transaminase